MQAEMKAKKEAAKMLKEAEDKLQQKIDEVRNEQRQLEMESAKNIEKSQQEKNKAM